MIKRKEKMNRSRTIYLILIVLSTYLLSGCASTLQFLFDVDDNLTYNAMEKKWEQREK